MEQHLLRQCSERLLCLSNYICSEVLDNRREERRERGRGRGRGRGEERRRRGLWRCQVEKIRKTVIKRRKGRSNSLTHTHTRTHTTLRATGNIKAPWDTSSSQGKKKKQTKKKNNCHCICRRTLAPKKKKKETQWVAYVATTAEEGRIALGDICVLSCLSPQHVSSAKYALPDSKSARTLRATQICLQTKSDVSLRHPEVDGRQWRQIMPLTVPLTLLSLVIPLGDYL